MNQPRRWAMPLAALLMTASLVCAPREGSARLVEPRLVPGDPLPTQEMGGPDVPPNPGPLMSLRVGLSSALLARGLQVDLAMEARAPKRSLDARLVRFAPRVTANP
jgi:hypothetical protein